MKPAPRPLPAHRLILSSALACIASALSLVAQTAAPAPGTVKLQEFVVTGSNIRRLDMEKIAPVTVIDRDAIETRNAVLPVDLLTSLPSVVNLPENETRLGSSGARGDNANINLRNLGATGTLILVNGRRMAINPMTAGLSQAVNVNQLPTQGVERVEVLRDGASAVYGSDAVGGVINYVLRRRFAGAESSVHVGLPEAGGGESFGTSFTFGTPFANGKGQLFGTVEALYREPILLSDRDFSRTSNQANQVPAPFNTLGGVFDVRSARGYYPTFRIGSGTASNYLRLVNGVPTLASSAPTRTGNPEFYLDLNPFGWSAPRVRRANAFVSGEYEINPRLSVYADAAYYKSRSNMVRQPLALNAPTSDKLAVLSVDNPYNPYGSAFYSPTGAPRADGAPRLTGEPRTISLVSVTLPDLDPENIETEADVVRLAAGVKGSLGQTWSWESSAFYNEVRGKDNAYPDVRESLLQQALARTDANAYNPFGYTFKVEGGAVVVDKPYTNPAAVVKSFSEIYTRSATSSITSGDFRATGRVVPLWAGDLMVALGGEYRKEDLADTRPALSGENGAASGLDPLDNDFLLHPPRPDVFGNRNVTSLYSEFALPLIAESQQIPLVHTLELTASGRHERYSDFGSTTKPKIGLNWRPASWLMLRGSYNEGFMAPSLAALFTSPRWSITAGAGDIDPYRNPVTNEGAYVQRTYFGGNPNLRASESVGKTFGVVIDVPGLKGLSVSADYWHIERTDLLGQRSVTQIRDSDVALLSAYTKAQLAAGKTIGQIDLGSGTADYKGDPDVVRFALTAEDIATFATYNAANPTAPVAAAGKIFSVNRPFINIASSEDAGVDLGLRYDLPPLAIGQFAFQSDWAYTIKSISTSAPANLAPTINDNLNTDGVARWRGTTNLMWRRGAWSAGLAAYYYGATQDSGATTTEALYESLGRPEYIAKQFTGGRFVYRYVTKQSLSFNATIGYKFGPHASPLLRHTKVRLGIVNFTDEAPPLATGGFGYNPSVSQNLVPGRTWTLDVTRTF